ncbi:DUF4232 domain-containing protein [Streptomyces sp. NPDC018031]|uniref:DUF4232 domain-containing protein n=1 Tax=Streptomyces sp. NPDC018031 TaxID=3365033 RepID=UPI0037AA4718
MRTATISRPAVLAATAAAVLGLSFTAFAGEDGGKHQGAASARAAGAGEVGSVTTAGGAAAPGKAGEVTAGSENPDSGSSAVATQAGARKRTGGKTPVCAADDVRISAAKQAGVPTTHITLTATNVSGRACTLLRYPLIAFGDLQTAKDVPSVAKSKPGAPLVLNPGAPAYAAVRVNDGGVDEKTRTVTSFYVNLFAADGPAEGSKVVTAPRGGIAVDDAVAKTGYWTHELRNGADDF